MAKLTPQQALDSKGIFYAKKWQQNGYYPIYKFVYDKEKELWEQFAAKDESNPKWRSWGYGREEPLTLSDGQVVTNYSWWLYSFEAGHYILSDEEMRDTKNFNLK